MDKEVLHIEAVDNIWYT